MSYEVTFTIRDKEVKNGAVLVTPPAPPASAIKLCLANLKALGYPMRNTTTELIRELLYLKFEADFTRRENEAELRGADPRGSVTRVGAGKAPNTGSAV